jgi:hypothetical protein
MGKKIGLVARFVVREAVWTGSGAGFYPEQRRLDFEFVCAHRGSIPVC